MADDTLRELVELSLQLGRPELDYCILGEGNTSARADEGSFWVKASGAELARADASSFVRVDMGRVLALLEGPELSDQAIKEALEAARLDPAAAGRPSVETVLHAACLSLEGVRFVGHTHPTAVNALTCSLAFEEAFTGRLFPDEIVLCGPASLLVPYTDPGLPLARAVRGRLAAYLEEYGEPPKVILLQNHGLFALGRSAREVAAITAMAVKAARVLLGTYAAGGPRFLPPEAVARIHTRPDEAYRRRKLGA
jgi:rhamnose utilization protein RhaD (predicted bifunctional aldolase and dehydrogenase)